MGDGSDLALEKVEVEDRAHNFSLSLPRGTLAEDKSVSDDLLEPTEEGEIYKLDIAPLESAIIELPDEEGVDQVDEYFSIEAVEDDLVVAVIILDVVLAVSVLLDIGLLVSELGSPNDVERIDFSLIERTHNIFVPAVLPVGLYHSGVQPIGPEKDDHHNHYAS